MSLARNYLEVPLEKHVTQSPTLLITKRLVTVPRPC